MEGNESINIKDTWHNHNSVDFKQYKEWLPLVF